MTNRMTFYDIVDMSIAAAMESNPGKKTDDGVLELLQNDCEALDRIAADNDCEAFTANVDGDAATLSITFPGLEFRGGRSSAFFDVIEHCETFSFHNEHDAVVLTLRYGGIFL